MRLKELALSPQTRIILNQMSPCKGPLRESSGSSTPESFQEAVQRMSLEEKLMGKSLCCRGGTQPVLSASGEPVVVAAGGHAHLPGHHHVPFFTLCACAESPACAWRWRVRAEQASACVHVLTFVNW